MNHSPLCFVTLAVAVTLAAPAFAAGKAPSRDRDAILAMTGNYKVRFDMRETVALTPGYTPLEPKLSGGYEAVRVIADRGDFISLQHILVGDQGGKPVVVKHWRQDWTYQPAKILSYEKANRWSIRAVPVAQRKGAWSQTVWQTDDSPRYGGLGRWTYSGGVTRWQSDETLRPLARRDAIRSPVYAWYSGWNRHVLTPVGWVHEQDNAKMGLRDGTPTTFVHEVVLNTYVRSDAFAVKAADDYWASTKTYWGEVRRAWDRAIDKDAGVTVTEEAQNGSVTGPRLMELADQIAEGKIQTDPAVIEARALISGPSKERPVPPKT